MRIAIIINAGKICILKIRGLYLVTVNSSPQFHETTGSVAPTIKNGSFLPNPHLLITTNKLPISWFYLRIPGVFNLKEYIVLNGRCTESNLKGSGRGLI